MRRLLGGIVLLIAVAGCAERPRLVLGSTHTLEDSGLLPALTEAFNAAQDEYRVSAVVAGSGEVLAMGANGDVDVLLTHSPEDEIAFMAAGRGVSRQPVMYNQFVLLGPVADPARADSAAGPVQAMRAIQQAAAQFISRGDDSGTHRRERALWADAGIVPEWSGYVEAATGMADALRLADQRSAYILGDRATYEKLRAALPRLRIVQQDDERLMNQYSVIVVTGARNTDGANAFAAWLRGAEAQALIESFASDSDGRPLFTGNAQ